MNTIARIVVSTVVSCGAVALVSCSGGTEAGSPRAESSTTPLPGTTERTTTERTTTAPPTTDDVDVLQITVGDCLVEDVIPDEEGGQVVGDQKLAECTAPHASEVYAGFPSASAQYPGEDALVTESQNACIDAFTAFVGVSYDQSVLDVSYLYPTSDSWRNGDREILCLISDPAGQSSGSLRGAAR